MRGCVDARAAGGRDAGGGVAEVAARRIESWMVDTTRDAQYDFAIEAVDKNERRDAQGRALFCSVTWLSGRNGFAASIRRIGSPARYAIRFSSDSSWKIR